MTRNVRTVFPNDRIEHAARLMRECDCGALPVVNNYGRLIGMVTDRDIVMRLVARGADTRGAVVADCMTDETFSCHVNDRLDGCLRQMARHQVRRLPIINDNEQIVGIISQGDLARHAEAFKSGERRKFADTVSEISEPSSVPYR
jgi:CBS domain-containing protein